MATTKAKATKAPADEPAPATPDEAVTHDGWAHDWRNPDATFDRSDHCPNAELRRLSPQ